MNITNADNEQTLGCINGKESLLISPIINWSEHDVWEFLNDVVSVPHCSLYDEGWKRIGCIGCPMSSRKQKLFENKRYPHVKRNWIKAIKAIRPGGGYSKENISGGTSARIGSQSQTSEDYSGRARHRGGGLLEAQAQEASSQKIGCKRQPNSYQKDIWRAPSSDRLTEEQENEIAENIYDWWISGVSYKKWYAQKFLQLKFNFDEDGETN